MKQSAVRLKVPVVGCLTKRKQLLRKATGDGVAGNKERDKETPAAHRKDKSDSPFFNNASTNARGHPGSRANLGRSRALAQPPVQKSGKKKRSRRHRQRRGAERREADGVAFFSPKRRHHEARWALSRRRCHSCQAQFMEFLAGFAAVNNTGVRSSRVQPNFAATSVLAPSLASTTVAEARTHRHTYYTERIGSNVASRRPGVERSSRLAAAQAAAVTCSGKLRARGERRPLRTFSARGAVVEAAV
ncbi:hypothetical protein HPB52_002276 [Rhipicephalus sanguineus]|uniref:Uncharacterized protein n=1 Tax=Rhipicephalus sanguineus TaxID=34632 RepID=A0A9D4QGF0_RHISA|nr:hypothetical protein HPB52_002276 [Rhipicephalus sanguineus]